MLKILNKKNWMATLGLLMISPLVGLAVTSCFGDNGGGTSTPISLTSWVSNNHCELHFSIDVSEATFQEFYEHVVFGIDPFNTHGSQVFLWFDPTTAEGYSRDFSSLLITSTQNSHCTIRGHVSCDETTGATWWTNICQF